MSMGNTIGSSNFRGAANATAISQEWCANHAADRDRRVYPAAWRRVSRSVRKCPITVMAQRRIAPQHPRTPMPRCGMLRP